MTIDEKARRIFGYGLCSMQTAREICDAIEDAAEQASYATVDALAAGVDATTPVFASLDAVTVTKLCVLPQGDFSGVDGSNTVVIAFKVGSTTKATKTYTTEPDGSLIDMEATSFSLAAGEILTITITNGTTAASPRLLVGVMFTIN